MMDEFYVVLPSNLPGSGNTTSQFTVRIPHTLELDANWTVALASIIYPFSFPSVGIDEDDLINIKLVNPNYKFPDDRRFVNVELKVPSMQFSNIQHLRQTLNDLIREEYSELFHRHEKEEQVQGKYKRQTEITDIFFHENPVDYREKIGEIREKLEELENEIRQDEDEHSSVLTIFFHDHPEDYNKKLNEARLVFTKYLLGLQEKMSQYIGEKDPNKISQINKEILTLREKIKYLQRNLHVFENAALLRDHQKSFGDYERLSHDQNSAFVQEFFTKYPMNYWQIIHNNYDGLREQFEKIENLQKKLRD